MTGVQTCALPISKIAEIRTAIEEARELKFRYFSPKGESLRCIEPYYLIFRWSSWYVWGWCTAREDYRLFKLNRMDNLCVSGRRFVKRAAPLPDLRNERIFPGGLRVKIRFAPDCKWRLVEEFGVDSFQTQEDGTLLFCADYTDKENLLSWLLSFREKAELLEPEEIRRELYRSAGEMRKKYEK